MTESRMRTPLSRVRHLGSAHNGTGHFWHQRLTSVANVPLTIAAIVIIMSILGHTKADMTMLYINAQKRKIREAFAGLLTAKMGGQATG